jgi:hypothetical protein
MVKRICKEFQQEVPEFNMTLMFCEHFGLFLELIGLYLDTEKIHSDIIIL